MTDRRYPTRPFVGIGVVLFTPDLAEVLLVRRGQPPGLGAWSLPGGAQHLGEAAEATARRELLEETGLTAGALTLVAHVDSIHPDADGRIEYHYTILDFAGVWSSGTPRAADDAADCRFVALHDLAAFQLTAAAVSVIDKARALPWTHQGVGPPGPPLPAT